MWLVGWMVERTKRSTERDGGLVSGLELVAVVPRLPEEEEVEEERGTAPASSDVTQLLSAAWRGAGLQRTSREAKEEEEEEEEEGGEEMTPPASAGAVEKDNRLKQEGQTTFIPPHKLVRRLLGSES
ncbi:unnamed protein product [Pleuronectes platessa]|uniref:Uncharacterized protein n=1 Tax=Pleuronectes platessa TaxID=8262 RepID=A0A9N7ZBV5_PLEPL|nr:unnamed protein product [Pleuronectes platessa]